MSTNRGRTLIFAGVIGGLVLAGGAVAFAAIPNPTTGVISGCYTTASPHVLRVIDTAKTPKCPTGTTALNWNQKGPQGVQGPAGPAGSQGPPGVGSIEVVPYSISVVGNPQWLAGTAKCPAGSVVTGGGFSQTDTGAGQADVVMSSVPLRATDGSPGYDGWQVLLKVVPDTGNQHGLSVWAVCLANPSTG